MINLAVIGGTRGQKAKSVADYLVLKYPDKVITSGQIKTGYENIILTQNPRFVRRNMLELTSSIYFLRPEYISYTSNNATNGYSIYKNNHYKYCIPMMYDLDTSKITNDSTEPVYGYYETPYRKNKEIFYDFIISNKDKIKNISILSGVETFFKVKSNFHDEINIKHYTDKFEFFSSITHYVFPKSLQFIDPWPTTLEEAVRCNKQIIILPNKRNFVDGIDDIETCIKYHTGIDDKIYDNSQCSINKFDFDKYYDYVIDKKFQIEDNYFNNNYNTFNEWIINNNLIKKED